MHQFAEQKVGRVTGVAEQDIVCLVQDGARYHTSARTRAFFEEHKRHLTVFDLASYSPDCNPIEKLWKKVKEKGTHLHDFPTFESLKEKVQETMSFFEGAKKEVLCLFEMDPALARGTDSIANIFF
ncbi:MAG: hypothetical protein N838_31425 [Thiohalocapsa sp. PB-PSB1]|nr:MAG: hypothetical protein N838_11340 [Thiohalocapsa sp. PB-PSB1]QQO57189.1 MAG: hypothetical protein N838_31425 [Thiohalocapsa sp. PB-PSB1]